MPSSVCALPRSICAWVSFVVSPSSTARLSNGRAAKLLTTVPLLAIVTLPPVAPIVPATPEPAVPLAPFAPLMFLTSMPGLAR